MMKNIVETAEWAGWFKTLLTAAKAAGLVETLKGDGPFTVFAPTDEAFAKVPKADLDALLADPKKLAEVLKYHVVAGKILAKDVANVKSVRTLQGKDITVDSTSWVKVDGAKVTKGDIEASNGVIHAIDSVLMPK